MIEVVCGVLRDNRGAILACQRPPGARLGGLWEFPGGKVEPDEDPAEALRRELREELDVEVEVGPALNAVTWPAGDPPIRLLPFLCSLRQGVPRPLEHTEIRWCRLDEAAALAWAPADLPILAELRASGLAEA